MAYIIVIQNDTQDRERFREALEQAGHRVEEASNGQVGVRLYKKQPANVVITGIVMPEKDGLETIQELKRDFPDVRIIAVSGYDTGGALGFLALAKDLGAARTFRKPVSSCTIVDCVEALLGETADEKPDSGSA